MRVRIMATPADKIPQLLTAEELAAKLGVTADALRARARRGEIPGVVKLGRKTIRFRQDVILEWITSSENAAATA